MGMQGVKETTMGYLGESLNIAKKLALNCPQEWCVHLLRSTKEGLIALETAQFALSPQPDAYYLEPDVNVDFSKVVMQDGVPTTSSGSMGIARFSSMNSFSPQLSNAAPVTEGMSKGDMCTLLSVHHIDVDKFSSDAIDELYDEMN